MKVGLLYDEEALPAYIAQQEGLFQKNGVNVQLIPFRSAVERDSAIQSGAVDGAEGDLIEVSLLNQGGFPVKAVTVLLGAKPEEGRFYILAAPHTITNVADLKGKTLAVSQNTIIDFLADEMLTLKGVNPDQVQKVYVPNMPLRVADVAAETGGGSPAPGSPGIGSHIPGGAGAGGQIQATGQPVAIGITLQG